MRILLCFVLMVRGLEGVGALVAMRTRHALRPHPRGAPRTIRC